MNRLIDADWPVLRNRPAKPRLLLDLSMWLDYLAIKASKRKGNEDKSIMVKFDL
jgi:hypothetical protein